MSGGFMLVALTRRIVFGKRRALIKELLEAVSNQRLQATKDQPSGWLGRRPGVHLTNDNISLLYREMWIEREEKEDKEHREILDIHPAAYRGRISVTFTDGTVTAMEQNLIIEKNVKELSEEEKNLLWKILLRVRNTAHN